MRHFMVYWIANPIRICHSIPCQSTLYLRSNFPQRLGAPATQMLNTELNWIVLEFSGAKGPWFQSRSCLMTNELCATGVLRRAWKLIANWHSDCSLALDWTNYIFLVLVEGISWSNFWQIDNKYSCRYLTCRTTIGLHCITFTARKLWPQIVLISERNAWNPFRHYLLRFKIFHFGIALGLPCTQSNKYNIHLVDQLFRESELLSQLRWTDDSLWKFTRVNEIKNIHIYTIHTIIIGCLTINKSLLLKHCKTRQF